MVALRSVACEPSRDGSTSDCPDYLCETDCQTRVQTGEGESHAAGTYRAFPRRGVEGGRSCSKSLRVALDEMAFDFVRSGGL